MTKSQITWFYVGTSYRRNAKMAYETILYSVEEGVVTLTFNRLEVQNGFNILFVMKLWLPLRKLVRMPQ